MTKNTNIRSDNSLSVKRVVDGTSVVKKRIGGLGFILHDRGGHPLVHESLVFSGQGVSVRMGFAVLSSAGL